jgi:hypothetical protein
MDDHFEASLDGLHARINELAKANDVEGLRILALNLARGLVIVRKARGDGHGGDRIDGAPMTQADFVACLQTDLALRGVAYDRAELLAWVAAMWPWLEDEPDVGRWAGEFVGGRRVEQPA